MTVKDKPTIILDGRKFDWLDSEIVTFLELWNEYTKSSNETIEIVKQIAKVADYVMLDESAQPQYFETAIINLDTNEVIRTSYIDLEDGEDS